MKKQLITTLLILLLANNVAAKAESPAAPGVALESETPQTKQPVSKVPLPPRGEMLYTNHCLSCHESIVHIREKRSAKNLELDLKWSSHEVEDVVLYLNLRYYHYSE